MKDLYIIGAGGFGREVEWLVNCINEVPSLEEAYKYLKNGYNVLAFVDQLLDDPEYKGPTVVCKLPVISGSKFIQKLKKHPMTDAYVVIAIGDPKRRFYVYRDIPVLSLQNIHFPSLIDQSVKYDKREGRVTIGTGTIICANSTMTTDIVIGTFVHINLDCTIGHDVVIGDFCTLSPGVHISGKVKIGEGVFLGTGAVILPGIEIGAGSIIGAGAVVTKDVSPNTTVVGIPAKIREK